MNNILNWISEYPHKAFLGIIPFILLVGYVLKVNTIDIQLHDTYMILDLWSVTICVSIYFIIVGIVYYLFRNRRFLRYVTILHTLVSILIVLLWIATSQSEMVRNPTEFEYARKVMSVVIMSLFVFITVQILFLMNLVISIVGKTSP